MSKSPRITLAVINYHLKIFLVFLEMLAFFKELLKIFLGFVFLLNTYINRIIIYRKFDLIVTEITEDSDLSR